MKKSHAKKPPSKKSPAKKPAPLKRAAAKAPAAPKPAARGATKAPAAPRKKSSRAVAAAEPVASAVAEPARVEPPAPAPPPRRAPVVDEDDDRLDAALIPGEAIDGVRLSRGIRYAAKVTPRTGDVVFTHSEAGQPLVSGHDLVRCHTAFLPQAAAFHLDASVPRSEAIELADALDGLSSPLVRIGADGLVLIRHGVGQPAMRFRVGTRAIVLAWAPPSQAGRSAALGSLRMAAGHQRDACAWARAIARSFQSRDGIEFINITDAETGDELARAVIAEDGKNLYAEDDRQTEIPGSRTAGMGGGGVAEALYDLRRTLRETGTTMTATASGVSVTLGGSKAPSLAVAAASPPDPDEAPTILVDGQPVEDTASAPETPAVPAPAATDDDAGEARVWIAQVVWDELSPDGARALTELVEPGSLSAEGGAWVSARVAAVARRTLVKVASDHDVTLHWGDAAPRTNVGEAVAGGNAVAGTRIWIRAEIWDDVEAEDSDEVFDLLGVGAVDDPEDDAITGWVTALVPEDKAPAFRALALRLHLAFEEGDAPPGATG